MDPSSMDAGRRALQAAMQAQTALKAKEEAKSSGFVSSLGHKWAVRQLQNKADVAMKELKNAGFDNIKAGFDKLYGETLATQAAKLGGPDEAPFEISDVELHLLLDLQENLEDIEKYEGATSQKLLEDSQKGQLEQFAGKKVQGQEAPQGGVVDKARHESHQQFVQAQKKLGVLIDYALNAKDVGVFSVLRTNEQSRGEHSTHKVVAGRLQYETFSSKDASAWEKVKAFFGGSTKKLERIQEIQQRLEAGYVDRKEFEKDMKFIEEVLGNAVQKACNETVSDSFNQEMGRIHQNYYGAKTKWANADAIVRETQGRTDHKQAVENVRTKERLELERRKVIKQKAQEVKAQINRLAGGYRFIEKCLSPDGKSSDQNWRITTVVERMRHMTASFVGFKSANKDAIKFREIMVKIYHAAEDGDPRYVPDLEVLEKNIEELGAILVKAQKEFEKAQDPGVSNVNKATRLAEEVRKNSLAARTPEIMEVQRSEVQHGDCRWDGEKLLKYDKNSDKWETEGTYRPKDPNRVGDLNGIEMSDGAVYKLSPELAASYAQSKTNPPVSGNYSVIRLTTPTKTTMEVIDPNSAVEQEVTKMRGMVGKPGDIIVRDNAYYEIQPDGKEKEVDGKKAQNLPKIGADVGGSTLQAGMIIRKKYTPVDKLRHNLAVLGESLATAKQAVQEQRKVIEPALEQAESLQHASNVFVAPPKLPELIPPGPPPVFAMNISPAGFSVQAFPVLNMAAVPVHSLPPPIPSKSIPKPMTVPDLIIPAPPEAAKAPPVVTLTNEEKEYIDRLDSNQLRKLLLKINSTILEGTTPQSGVGDTSLPKGFFLDDLPKSKSRQDRVGHHAPKLAVILAHVEARAQQESGKNGVSVEKQKDWEDIKDLCEAARKKHPALKNANVSATLSGGTTTVTTKTTTGTASPKTAVQALLTADQIPPTLSAGIQGIADAIQNAQSPQPRGRLNAFVTESPASNAYKELQELNKKIQGGQGTQQDLERANYLVSYFQNGIKQINDNHLEIQAAVAHNQNVKTQETEQKQLDEQDSQARHAIAQAKQDIVTAESTINQMVDLSSGDITDSKMRATGEVLSSAHSAFKRNQGKVAEAKVSELANTPANEKLSKEHANAAKELASFYEQETQKIINHATTAGPIKAQNDANRLQFEKQNAAIQKEVEDQSPKTQEALAKMNAVIPAVLENKGKLLTIEVGKGNRDARLHNLLFTGDSGDAYKTLVILQGKINEGTASLDELKHAEQLADYFTGEIGKINKQESEIDALLTKHQAKMVKNSPQSA